YFVAVASVIWHTNLWVIREHRRRFSADPAGAKLSVLLATVVLATLPEIGLATAGWMAVYRVDLPLLAVVAVVTAGCAVAVTHVYETGYLIKARARDALRLERLEHARAVAELDALRSYIDPHFLFNNLNTLSHLIADDPDRALAFNDSLSDVYRYIL